MDANTQVTPLKIMDNATSPMKVVKKNRLTKEIFTLAKISVSESQSEDEADTSPNVMSRRMKPKSISATKLSGIKKVNLVKYQVSPVTTRSEPSSRSAPNKTPSKLSTVKEMLTNQQLQLKS